MVGQRCLHLEEHDVQVGIHLKKVVSDANAGNPAADDCHAGRAHDREGSHIEDNSDDPRGGLNQTGMRAVSHWTRPSMATTWWP